MTDELTPEEALGVLAVPALTIWGVDALWQNARRRDRVRRNLRRYLDAIPPARPW